MEGTIYFSKEEYKLFAPKVQVFRVDHYRVKTFKGFNHTRTQAFFYSETTCVRPSVGYADANKP